MDTTTLIQNAVQNNATDLHLMSEEIPRIRVADGLIELGTEKISNQELLELLRTLAPSGFEAKLDRSESVEWNKIEGATSFSAIAHRAGGTGLAVTFRIFSNQVPSLDNVGIGLEPIIERVSNSRSGIVIVSGVTGSGKWTVVGSLIASLNQEKSSRIFVISSCANFMYEKGKALLTQLFVGQDCASYSKALDFAHGSDPDIIALDDIPNHEVLRQAILGAESGHLVIFNLHASSPIATIESMLDTVGIEGPSLLRSLASNLIAITSQRLVPRADKPGRAAVYQWVMGNDQTRKALSEGDLVRLQELQAEDPECQTEAQAWAHLVSLGIVH